MKNKKNDKRIGRHRRTLRPVNLLSWSLALILACSLPLLGAEAGFAAKSADGVYSSGTIESMISPDSTAATQNSDSGGSGGRVNTGDGIGGEGGEAGDADGALREDGYLIEMNDSGAAGLPEGKSMLQEKDATAALPDVDGVEYVETVAPASEDLGSVIEVSISEEAINEGAIEELEASPNVKLVQPNYIYSLLENPGGGFPKSAGSETNTISDGGPANTISNTDAAAMSFTPLDTGTNDPYLNSQYYLKGLADHGANVLSAWDTARSDGTSGSTVTVAVLDTGIRADHEDLVGNMDTAHMKDVYANTPAGTITSSANPTGDIVGHGTHVAGIVAGVADNGIGIAGASYNAKVLPLKVFNNAPSRPEASTADLVKSYTYLLDLVQREELTNLHVINMSLGGYGSMDQDDIMLKSKIATARDAYDILTVCAGGNGDEQNNPITDPMYPGDYDECMSVTALEPTGYNAKWSDYNPSKDISAPGVYINSTYNSSKSSYFYNSGTSMASPLVAGCAALLWGMNDQLTVEQVKDSIYSTAHPINDPVYDRTVKDATDIVSGSHGSIDAAAALAYAQTNYPARPRTALSDCVATPIDKQFYTGADIKPTLNVVNNGYTLVENIDYKATWGANRDVGAASVRLLGIGDYKGVLSLGFNIYYDFSAAEPYAMESSYLYSGQPVEPSLRIKFGNRTIKEGVDYTLAYYDNNAVGTGRVIATGIGHYSGVKEIPFNIISHDISNAVASGLNGSYTYNGSAVTPDFKLLFSGRLLVRDIDYTVAFSGNNAIGTATITITGRKEFTGTKTLYFNLVKSSVTDDKESEAPARKGWIKEGSDWHYYQTDVLQKGWQQIDGSWYYLDPATGHMLSGWQQVDGKWYYLKTGADGKAAAVSGWQQLGDRWYYLKIGVDGKAAAVNGWQKLGGRWYYLKPGTDGKGSAVSGLQKVDGKWYYLKAGADGKGSIVSGKIKIGSKTYYFKESKNGKHAMVSGWQKIKGKKYYFKKAKDGKAAMVKGQVKIGGKRYVFDKYGVLKKSLK